MKDQGLYHEIIIAGSGGQGVLFMGEVLAHGAMKEGKWVTFLPSYGIEMRGGTANCTVVISHEEIGSPTTENPHFLVVLNQESLIRFQHMPKPNGLILVNTSLIDLHTIYRKDLEIIPIPANEIAAKMGNVKMANMVALGAFLKRTRMVAIDSITASLKEIMAHRPQHLINSNIQALIAGGESINEG